MLKTLKHFNHEMWTLCNGCGFTYDLRRGYRCECGYNNKEDERTATE